MPEELFVSCIADMSNSIELAIDIDFLGGIDIGIDIDNRIFETLALTLTLGI